MERKDWTLLAIAAGGGEPVSPVQLQKSLFLLGRKLPQLVGSDFYVFRPYNYGPFAIEVYQDAESLEIDGLVSISAPEDRRWNEYAATPVGLARAQELRTSGDAPTAAVQYLEVVVAWARTLSFNDLVRSIYAQYPEFKENSVFQPA